MDKHRKLIERVKSTLDCRTNTELAERLNIHVNQVYRWQKSGFYPSTLALINELLNWAGSKEETNTVIDYAKVLEARDRIKLRTGFNDIEITELRRELRCNLDTLKEFILEKSRQGMAVLTMGDWSLSDEPTREGVIYQRGKPYLMVRFKEPQERQLTC